MYVALHVKYAITEAVGVVQRVNFSYKESRNDDAHLWLMLPKLSPSPNLYKVLFISVLFIYCVLYIIIIIIIMHNKSVYNNNVVS